MPDMLVKLYELRDNSQQYKKLEEMGIKIIRPMTPNKTKVLDWVSKTFPGGWSDELSTAFTRFPVSCLSHMMRMKRKFSALRDTIAPTVTSSALRGLTKPLAERASAAHSLCAVWRLCVMRAMGMQS